MCSIVGGEGGGGRVLSTLGSVQYRGDIMSTLGGYLEYRGGYHEGDILSTVGIS